MIHDLLNKIKESAERFTARPPSRCFIIHHNDSDGLSSGAILIKAVQRVKIPFSAYCLEKPYPQVLDRIFSDPDLDSEAAFIFTDFASGMLPEISRINAGRFRIIVLDHHRIEPVQDEKIDLVNCLEYGVSGSFECSASAICCLFAGALSPFNADLSKAGVLGALGDGMLDASGRLSGVNRVVEDLALREGLITFDGGYRIKSGANHPAEDLVRWIDSLGSFGYFDSGPDVAIKGLCGEFSESYIHAANLYLEKYRKDFAAFASGLVLKRTDDIQWFILPESFRGYGVKTVGLVCQDLIREKLVSEDMYLAGFQAVPNQVPGLGSVAINQMKLSMRIPPALLTLVKAGERRALTDFLPQAAAATGGFSDACHVHAGAVTVKPGEEERIVQEMQSRL